MCGGDLQLTAGCRRTRFRHGASSVAADELTARFVQTDCPRKMKGEESLYFANKIDYHLQSPDTDCHETQPFNVCNISRRQARNRTNGTGIADGKRSAARNGFQMPGQRFEAHCLGHAAVLDVKQTRRQESLPTQRTIKPQRKPRHGAFKALTKRLSGHRKPAAEKTFWPGFPRYAFHSRPSRKNPQPTQTRALRNMRIQAPVSCQSAGCQAFCTVRKQRSG